jgi:hypothetical protein
MTSEIRVCAVHHRFMEACPRNARLEVIDHRLLRYTAHKDECPNV